MRGSRLDMLKSLKITFISFSILLLLLVIFVRFANFYPGEIQEEPVTCAHKAPFLEKKCEAQGLELECSIHGG